MLRTGWALWDLTAVYLHQADDFLRDGFQAWRQQPAYTVDSGLAYLEDLYTRLQAETAPNLPADFWRASPESVEPASKFHSLRCWAAGYLVTTADESGRGDIVTQYGADAYRSIAETPRDFVAPRWLEFAEVYAQRNGLSPPWQT
jgi:hypothetical protein